MLYWLAKLLTPHYSGFNVFSYLTVRAIFAVITGLALGLLLGPWMIEKLRFGKVGQVVRDDGPKSHFSKAGTPTMGGMLILIAIFASTLLWSDLSNRFVWVVLGVTFTFGLIGFWDDYLKLAKKNPKGLIARYKYSWQSLFGLAAAVFLFYTAKTPAETTLYLPFFKNFAVPMGAVAFIAAVVFHDRRHEQRGESHRRARRSRDHAVGHGGRCARRVRVCQRQRELRAVPVDSGGARLR